jgi:probable HAF family extracellular repeat protein
MERWEERSQNPKQQKERETMKNSSLFLIGLMACLAIGISSPARAQVFYTLEDLGVVKDMDYSMPAAINNQAYVAGTAYKAGQTCAFHYDYTKKFMDDAGGVNSRAFGISSTDIVVGDNFFVPGDGPELSHAAMFKSGYVLDLGLLQGQVFSRANGVNAMGQVVGYSGLERDSKQSKAFMWSSQTGMIDIGTLGGAYAQAYAINDAGAITGGSQLATMGLNEITHAFIYNPACMSCGGMTDLGTLGGNSSYGMAINGNNHVAGYSTFKANDNRTHAFLHDGTRMIDLGSLGGGGSSDVSAALGINNLDQVVGYTYLPTPPRGGMPLQQVAFLWRPNMGGGQMINLNTLLMSSTRQNYLLVSATAINDNGQIVATAYDMLNGGVRAVLLTPQGPAPVSSGQ